MLAALAESYDPTEPVSVGQVCHTAKCPRGVGLAVIVAIGRSLALCTAEVAAEGMRRDLTRHSGGDRGVDGRIGVLVSIGQSGRSSCPVASTGGSPATSPAETRL